MVAKKFIAKIPSKASLLPASRGMLQLVRDELKADIRGHRSETNGEFASLRGEMTSGFARVDGEIASLRGEMISGFARVDGGIASLRGETSSLRSELGALRIETRSGFIALEAKMDSKFEKMTSEIARIGVLVEEQNANNRIVLEGLTGLWQRQEKFESKLTDEVERTVALHLTRIKS